MSNTAGKCADALHLLRLQQLLLQLLPLLDAANKLGCARLNAFFQGFIEGTELLFAALALGEVAGDFGKTDQVPVIVPDRGNHAVRPVE